MDEQKEDKLKCLSAVLSYRWGWQKRYGDSDMDNKWIPNIQKINKVFTVRNFRDNL